jgi:hypothetical protein
MQPVMPLEMPCCARNRAAQISAETFLVRSSDAGSTERTRRLRGSGNLRQLLEAERRILEESRVPFPVRH